METMQDRNFAKLLKSRWDAGNFLCVGLDPDFNKIPEIIRASSARETIVAFNKAIIDATKDMVCTFKPNPAFYEAEGLEGWQALKETIEYILSSAPDVPILLDAKRGDIGNTNEGYARMAFDFFEVDAITLQPYQGGDALAPFFERKNKGHFILVRTSNPGAKEFQDLKIDGKPLYDVVARTVADSWNTNNNCGVVVGATYPKELQEVRALIGDMPILMPGAGAQGGDLEASVKAGKNSAGQGIIINASRAVLYASSGKDFADAARTRAREYHSAIQKAL
jgi:orotidine-5'-phosphate decarboxylase